jgi:hypothetical protein
MIKKLTNLLNTFRLFNFKTEGQDVIKNEEEDNLLPFIFENSEKIARAVYSPMNLHRKDKTKLNTSFYKPPSESDEVSVNRLDYTNSKFLKKLAKHFQNTDKDRSYFGFSIVEVNDIINSDLGIVYSPIKKPLKFNELENISHSDIKIGHVVERGKELPAEVSKRIKDLTKVSRLYDDPNIDSEDWLGNELK